MLLVIDIGNTNITVGTFRFEGSRTVRNPSKVWRLATHVHSTADEYGPKLLDLFHYALLDSSDIKGIAVASVVPALDSVFDDMLRRYFGRKPFFVSSEKTAGITLLLENPREIGADRIADAVAAYTFFGGPAIVVDFGTATTFDCIGKKGEYLGGIIAPGPTISAEALARRTAKLPRVEISCPDTVIGKSTVHSMQAGLYFGYIGLVKEILRRIRKEMSGNPYIVATGGLASLIVNEVKEVRTLIPELTLEGIRIIWDKMGTK